MFQQHSDFDELGLKVQRAQHALERIRGVGTVNGIRVIVDAESRLLSVTVNEEDIIMEAYRAAVADKEPKVAEAMQELRADSRFEAVSTFTEANSAQQESKRLQRERSAFEEDNEYFADRNRRGWLEG